MPKNFVDSVSRIRARPVLLLNLQVPAGSGRRAAPAIW
jgi:hypothetical protein